MRKIPKDKNAPRKPPSAFMLFMRQQRLQSAELASLPFGERNRVVGAEWSKLSAEKKAEFFNQAKVEREKYNQSLAEYKKSDTYKNWLASAENLGKSASKKGRRSGKLSSSIGNSASNQPDFKIPIFTHEFLEYNKLRETVLRQLKKQAIQLEEETALLSKHVDNLVTAEARSKGQLQSIQEQYNSEEQLLKRLHKELVAALSEVAVPFSSTTDPNTKCMEHITETSVDAFLSRLQDIQQSGTNPEVIQQVVTALNTAVAKKTLKLIV
ncbi:unnamed protein product [Dicrocoelium dendriticum]|nr:unnamed protein product [Dicrocoelium dendriticum]